MGRNEKGLALGDKAQMSLIDLIGMSFIPLYSVVDPFVFFLSLLLMVWGSLRLLVTIFLCLAIIMKYRGCRVWVLMGKKIGKMLDEEVGRDQEM